MDEKTAPLTVEKKREQSAEEKKADEDAEREERRQRALARQARKEAIAKERGSLVIKTLYSPEAASFFNLGQQVEFLFEMPITEKIRRDQKSVEKAGLIYRKAFITFAAEMKRVSKILNSRIPESNYVGVFEQELAQTEQLQEFLEQKDEFEKWKASQLAVEGNKKAAKDATKPAK